MSKPTTPLTRANGAVVGEDQNSISAGSRGPLTFDNHHLFEKLAHFNRERIPERVVHARGSGAYGTFTLTKDLSEFTLASFLQDAAAKPRCSYASPPLVAAKTPAIMHVTPVALP